MHKVSMIIMSHLSDAQELMFGMAKGMVGADLQANFHINFAKWLTLQYKDNSIEIDADAEVEKYMARMCKTATAGE